MGRHIWTLTDEMKAESVKVLCSFLFENYIELILIMPHTSAAMDQCHIIQSLAVIQQSFHPPSIPTGLYSFKLQMGLSVRFRIFMRFHCLDFLR